MPNEDLQQVIFLAPRKKRLAQKIRTPAKDCKASKYSRGLMAWDLKRRGAGARSVSTRASFIIRRS